MPDLLIEAKADMIAVVDDWAARLRRQIAAAPTQADLDAITRRALDKMPDLLEGDP